MSLPAKLALATVLIVVALPATAFGQATRTWVSGVGDDANPCSRTAPCKTLAGAQSKTAEGGQISGIDGGGFGAVTITKALTIDLRRIWEPGVLTNVSNGVTVNAGADDRVRLLGLNINGLSANFHGIRILQARSVRIDETDIFNFNRNGISIENANSLVRVSVEDSTIHNSGGNAVLVAPQGANQARVTLRRNSFDDNTCGITATSLGADPAFNYASNCGTAGTNTATVALNAFDNSISDSERQGVFVNGAAATVRLGRNDVTGSVSAPALQAINGGSLLSYGNNSVIGNPGGNGASTGSAGPQL